MKAFFTKVWAWVIGHKAISIAAAAVAVAGISCAIVLPIALHHEHTFSETWTTSATEHWHAASCEHTDEVADKSAHTDGNGDFLCDDCGYVLHTHTYAESWSMDETDHWHAATCEHTDEVADKGTHTDGNGDFLCDVCSYVLHTHTYAESWSKDADFHWHVATCEHTTLTTGKAAHEWDAGVEVTAPTGGTDGVKRFTCTVCGQTKTEPIPALGFTITFDSKGGSAVSSITGKAGEPVAAPTAPERTGFVFLGWFADDDKSIFEGATPYVFDEMPENDITLYAKWALKLTVSYNGYDATVAMTSFNVTEANEDMIFAVDFEKINWDKSYIGVPMYRYEGEARIGLDTEVAKEGSKYVSAVFDDKLQNVYAEGDELWRYGAGDFYIKHDFSENGRYFISIQYATPGEYEIGVKVFNWKAAPTLELKDGVSKNKTYDGQPVSVTADDYATNSDGEVTVLWYDWSKNPLANAPVNAGAYYFKLRVSETSTADGNETEFQSKTTDYYKVVISTVEVRIETPHNFTYNGNTEYYVDYSTSAVNGETLMAYFIFDADNGEIWLDDWGFEVWGDVTEYTYNYVFVYEGSGDMATLNKKVISDLTLHTNYNGTTSFTGITGDKVTSTDIIKNTYGTNDFEKLTFSVTTSSKNVSATAYTVDFADVVIGGDSAVFYTLAESGNASVYIDRKELKNLRLTTAQTWTEDGSVEITLTETDGICAGEVVKVTISNGNYQGWAVGETFVLVLTEAARQGEETIALVANEYSGNYTLVETDGEVGTVEIVSGVTTLSNISFTSSDITSATSNGSNAIIKISLKTAHGITDGDDVEFQIVVSVRDVTNKATVTLTSGNTVISGTDAAKYELGTGCTVNLG